MGFRGAAFWTRGVYKLMGGSPVWEKDRQLFFRDRNGLYLDKVSVLIER
jgi:hypothetical protein